MRIYCPFCGQSVSTELPDDTILRAAAICPECLIERVTVKSVEDPMNKELQEQHRLRHQVLLDHLEELIDDYRRHTGQLPTQVTVYDLVKWARQEALDPTSSQDIAPP